MLVLAAKESASGIDRAGVAAARTAVGDNMTAGNREIAVARADAAAPERGLGAGGGRVADEGPLAAGDREIAAGIERRSVGVRSGGDDAQRADAAFEHERRAAGDDQRDVRARLEREARHRDGAALAADARGGDGPAELHVYELLALLAAGAAAERAVAAVKKRVVFHHSSVSPPASHCSRRS